jgi:phospholipase/carboxylesterase
MAPADSALHEQEIDESQLWSKEPSNTYVPKHDTDWSKFKPIFPLRQGTKPTTTNDEPHEQLDQLGPEELYHELHRRCFSLLPGVAEGDSLISFPESRALLLDTEQAVGPPESIMWSDEPKHEFAHIHPFPDSSMHVHLPLELAVFVTGFRWGEPHAVVRWGFSPATAVMLYAPRNEQELETIWSLVEESYRFATGQPQRFRNEPQPVD